jgi:putative DNA primase/helicase
MPKGKPELNGHASARLLAIGNFFEDFHRNGAGYKALCPAHADNKPSLSINDGKDGRIVLHCHADCEPSEVLAAVGLPLAALMPDHRIEIATYDYCDAAGNLLYQTVRYEPKDFRQRRPDGKGGWIWNLNGVERVLYRLPELLAANKREFVFVVEGEKDADRLAREGLVATTTVGGAKAPWLPSYTKVLRGRRVVLIPDNDDPGRERVKRIADALGVTL